MNKLLTKTYNLLIPLFVIVLFASTGCEEKLYDQPKFQKPDWVEGKLFTQIKEENDLTIFTACLEKTGFDTLLNLSGLYTVFAPTDEAFNQYFSANQIYSSIDDIPVDELEHLVKYQILQNAWSKDQFKLLDTEGWIDPTDEFYNEPRGYKRETLLRENNKAYPVRKIGNKITIVPEDEANATRIGYTRSRKYAPIFFQEYFDIYELSGADFEFYFDRNFDRNEIYFVNAMIISDEIFAENGFVFKTDRVVTPLSNAEEIMEKKTGNHLYNDFLELIHQFPEFSSNMEATYNQEGAELGLDVDTLYNINYPDLVFNVQNELCGPNTNQSKFTIRYHNGMIAPTNEAFEEFKSQFIYNGWGSLDVTPKAIKRILINSHMAAKPLYPSDLTLGFLNGEKDSVIINESGIVQKEYGSNCTFLGLNETVIPRAFISITRPVYLTRNYDIVMTAIEETKVLSALKRKNADYSFYIPRDNQVGLAGDSSLYKYTADAELEIYYLVGYNRAIRQWEWMNTGDLRKKLLNQVGTQNPLGIARKEFIPNLAGNYIVVDNEKNLVRGSANTTYGYNGDSVVNLKPELYAEPTDNGKTYNVSTWFKWSSGDFFGILGAEYSRFFNLLKKASLFDVVYYEFTFMTEGENYTAFIPTDEALNEFGIDTVSKARLREILQMHFLKGEIMFTDGKLSPGEYETTLVKPGGNSFSTEYTKMYVRPYIDGIEIRDNEGNIYVNIEEADGITNRVVMTDTDDESQSIWDFITTSVIHKIDKVLVPDLLQTN